MMRPLTDSHDSGMVTERADSHHAHRSRTRDLLGSRVCITGGRGVLGARLTQQLAAAGVEHITTFGRRPPDATISQMPPTGATHAIGDILDVDALENACRGCSVVFHLAGVAHAARNAEVADYHRLNAIGTLRVFEACCRASVSRLVFVSSAQVYGIPRNLPVSEDHPTDPRSPYAASKLAAENHLRSRARRRGVRCDIARLTNVYGPSLTAETVIGRALHQAAVRQPITVRDFAPVRDFLYVEDAVAALLALASCDSDADYRVVNVSSSRGVSVGEVAQTLARVAEEEGFGSLQVVSTEDGSRDEVPAMVLDNSRLRALTGWSPTISLDEGLRQALRQLAADRQAAS